MNLEILKNKKVLILGFGREGIDTFRFLRKLFPDKILGVGDQLEFRRLKSEVKNLLKRDKKVRWHLGKDYLKAIKDYDVIIKTPGIPPKVIKPFLKKGQRVTSQTEIFFENCPGKIIGITGTKGKSTTASLIYQVLKEGGLKAHLIGNIGKPALLFLSTAQKNEVFVYELSSHQLMNLKHSPHVAVFLNIFPEHLDYYKNLKQYKKAKENIAKYQTKKDFLVYNSDDKLVSEIAKISKAQKIPIKGEYYDLDRAAARAVGKIFKISKRKIEKIIKRFRGLPHRLEFVGTYKEIKFYNDSLSTIPETAVEAINRLGENLQTIILGGFERRQDFKKLAKKILDSNIETVILFPTTGKRIWKEINEYQRGRVSLGHFFVKDMKEAVKLCYQHTEKGKICLLSPASASFNLFKDYQERGNLFKKFIKQLAKK